MGHGIELVDQGIVWGDTWHRKEQYKRINRPIEAHEIKELSITRSNTYQQQ